jgi:hypothetical protein
LRWTIQPLALQSPHHQLLLAIQVLDTFVIHYPAALLQLAPQHPAAVARIPFGQLDQLLAELRVAIWLRFVAVAGSIHFQQLAGLALTSAPLLKRNLPQDVPFWCQVANISRLPFLSTHTSVVESGNAF